MVMRYKNKIILSIAIIVIAVVFGIFYHAHNEKNISNASPTLVQMAPVTVNMLPKTVQASGNLVAEKDTVITPRVSGYIQSIDVHEGEIVQAGTVLFQLDQEKEKEALDSAKAKKELSALEFQRDQQFLKKGFITQDAYYSAEVEKKQNQAALDVAKTDLADRKITAPFSGTAGAIPVSIGQLVNPGTVLTQLVDNQHLRAEYELPVGTLDILKLNQPVIITNLSKTSTLEGAVSYISPEINSATQMIAVHAIIHNPSQSFKPGEYVNITQTLTKNKETILVPEQSISAAVDHYSVFTVKENKALRLPVKIGARKNGYIEITDGLKPSDHIIISDVSQLHTGAPVEIASTAEKKNP